MARTARASQGGILYHVLNRGNGRVRVFKSDEDYGEFLDLIGEATARLPMRLLGFCLMPNHFHLVLWPHEDGDLGRWMQWLLTSHVRRHHRLYRSSGHVWQGRFKAFPIQEDAHLLAVLRYVEGNPLRASLVRHAEAWPWSSLSAIGKGRQPLELHPSPVDRPKDWRKFVNEPQTESEVEALRRSVMRGSPFGEERWSVKMAARLGLEASLRPRGRPRNQRAEK